MGKVGARAMSAMAKEGDNSMGNKLIIVGALAFGFIMGTSLASSMKSERTTLALLCDGGSLAPSCAPLCRPVVHPSGVTQV